MNYYELTNKIKGSLTLEWLTPSQESIFVAIRDKYRSQTIINIYGDPGTGKTFLAWMIEKELGGTYVKDISQISSCNLIVLDDFSHNRNSIRELIQEAFFWDIKKIIIITEKKAQDDITKLPLNLTEVDKTKFKNNLWKHLDFKFVTEKQEYNLNSLIKYNI